MTKAVFSRAKDTVSNICNYGFLGTQWSTQLKSDSWEFFSAPPIYIQIPTIPLGNIFFVFNGVTPSKNYKPVSQCPPNTECKLNWRMKWRDTNRLWADPDRVREEERWIRYGKEFLHTAVLNNSRLFDIPKILVRRKVNRGSLYTLAAQLDTIGVGPDNNIFYVLLAQEAGKLTQAFGNREFLEEWETLSYEEQRLWLLGILTSSIVNALSLIGRKTHEITSNELCKLLLPQKIDRRIILIVRQIIERDQQHLGIPQPDNLRIQLDEIVEESYGNPHCIEIKRTGEPPE